MRLAICPPFVTLAHQHCGRSSIQKTDQFFTVRVGQSVPVQGGRGFLIASSVLLALVVFAVSLIAVAAFEDCNLTGASPAVTHPHAIGSPPAAVPP